MSTAFPNPEDPLNFTLTLTPDEGESSASRCPDAPFTPFYRNVPGRIIRLLFQH